MDKFKKILFVIASIIFILAVVFFYGRYVGKKSGEIPKKEITSQVILDKIKDQYFLVTKTLFYNDEVSITISQNSNWKDVLWGETITAAGLVRVDIGVDLNKLKPEDVVVDHKNREITLYLQEAEILDSSLSGDLDINTKKGLFTNIKSVFSDDEGEDYNRAVKELVEQAKYAAVQNSEIFDSARNDSTALITLIVNSLDLDYRFKIEKKN